MEDPAKHLGLVARIAMRFTAERPIEDTDQFGDGCVGLLKAVQLYDPAKRTAFSTFAWYCIRTYILQGIQLRSQRGYKQTSTRERCGKPPGVVHLSALERESLTAQFPVDDPDHAARIDAAEFAERVLLLLDKRQRYVIEQCVMMGRTCVDVAPELGITKQAVWMTMELALQRIHKQRHAVRAA